MSKHGDYALGFKEEAFLLMKREFNVTWRNKFGLYIRLSQVCRFSSLQYSTAILFLFLCYRGNLTCPLAFGNMQVVILALFLGFLLFRVKHDPDQRNMNLYRTAFFLSVLNMTLFNLGHLPALMDERSIYYKQRGARFYRPISYLVGKIIGSSFFSICEVMTFAFPLSYCVKTCSS
jgi:hypothetical protein